MKQSQIEETVMIYFPPDEYSDEVRRYARLACENVEREVRQEIVNSIYKLAGQAVASPREQEER